MKVDVAVIAVSAALLGAGQIAAAADGKEVYDKSCGGCHNAMAPKLGDKAAWAPLAKKGTATLVASTVKGKGAMPPKGGAASLSEADIKVAVEYMVKQSK